MGFHLCHRRKLCSYRSNFFHQKGPKLDGTCEVTDLTSRVRLRWFRRDDLPYLVDSIALVVIPGWASSIYASLSLQNSAAFWPPWPSKTAKHPFAAYYRKQSLTKNYTRKNKVRHKFCWFLSSGDFLSTKVIRRFQIYSGSNKASLVKCICLNFVKLPYSVITYPVFLSISELSLANTHAKAMVVNSVVWLGHSLWLLEQTGMTP